MIPVFNGDRAKAWITHRRDGAPQTSAEARIPDTVRQIIEEVKRDGDYALHRIAARLRDPEPRCLGAASQTLHQAIAALTPATKETIEFAAQRIRQFAEAVMQSVQPVRLKLDEYEVGLDLKPVDRVACYVPGGRYPLASTALMTAITAQVAGVKDIALFSPHLQPEVLFAGTLAGVQEFHELGGAQAVAAATYGTKSVKPADMIVGPGNAYVAEAKRQVLGDIGIDMLAGPSEIAVIADANGDPSWVALDLLSQAEHDPDARSYLLTDSESFAEAVLKALPEMAREANAPTFVMESLAKSAVLVLDTMEDCVEAANQIAPEHLVLHVSEPDQLKPRLSSYGALFMGYNTTVPYGDYAAGPNHTLPTDRSARFTGGLSPLTFLRAQSWLDVKAPATVLSQRTAEFATIEGLNAHAAAAQARIKARAKR